MKQLEKMTDDFRRHCLARGLVDKTSGLYARRVQKYFELNDIRSPKEIFMPTQHDYHESLERLNLFLRAENHYTETTVNQYFCALDRFFSWQIYLGNTEINPVPFYRKNCIYYYKKSMPKQAYVPSLDEMRQFLKSIDDEMIRQMLIICCKTMMRKDELLSVRVNDVSPKHKMLMIKNHPKRQNRMVFLDDETMNAYRTVMEIRGSDQNPYLFLKKPGQPYTRTTAGRDLTKYAKKFGLYNPDGPRELNFTWNSCRRFGVTRLKEAGLDTDYIKWLRGDNMVNIDDMTIRYRAFDRMQIQTSYEKTVFKFGV